MAAEIKSEVIDLNGRSISLVSVKDGEAIIGTCSAGHTEHSGAQNSSTRLFYIGNDPVISLISQNHSNSYTDKLVSFCPGFTGYDKEIYDALTGSFSKLNKGESLLSGLRDVLCLLEDGVYAVYLSDYYPTDGNGSFFWGAYNISHEVRGTAEHNRTVGDRTFKPCFLMPTLPLDHFAARVKVGTDDAVKRRAVQGIVYHVSGFHSVLLKGHHGAVSCVENNVPFRCAVIEKITEPYTELIVPHVPEVEQQPATEGEEQTEVKQQPAPEPVPIHEGITGFRSPSVKIPIEMFPKDMLRQIIGGRPEYKPNHFNVLLAKLGTVRRKSITNNVLPYTILERAEQMPDCEMVESAFALDGLSDEQLNCLLRGDVECNGEVIVSPNFYSSVVTACNYLQFTDLKRFVDFSIAVMENPELVATHEYVAKRVSSQENNNKLYGFFKSVVSSDDSKYDKIRSAAETYVKRAENN